MDEQMNLPEYVNVSTMAKILKLSRSRLYQLIERGIVLEPVYLINNKRPVFTKEMVVRNMAVKNNNSGINGEIVMFYTARNIDSRPKRINKKSPEQRIVSTNKYTDIIDALESLGLQNINSSQIESAIQKCFTHGSENISDDEILTEIYRYMKCQNTEHKPRT